MFSLWIDCQICCYCFGVGNGCFQFQGCVIYYLNYVFFVQIGNVDCVGLFIDCQFVWLQWMYGFVVLMFVQYQVFFYGVGFGVNSGDSVVDGIVKLQCVGGMVDSGVEWFQIVVNNLCYVEGCGVKMVNYFVFVQ